MKTTITEGADRQWSAEAASRRQSAEAQARGYFTETLPAKYATQNTAALATGTLFAVGFGVCKGDTFSGCDIAVQTVGATLSLVKVAIARASDNVVLAVSADMSAAVTGAAGKKPGAFTAQHIAPDDDYYWFYMLSVGTTGPVVRCGSGQNVAQVEQARAGGVFKDAYARLTGQSDIVLGTAYAVAASSAGQTIWAGFY